MAHVLSSLRMHTLTYPAPPLTGRAAVRQQTASQSSAATQSDYNRSDARFRALFTGRTTPAAAEPPAQKPAPTAESVFGPNPWMSNPTGIGPTAFRTVTTVSISLRRRPPRESRRWWAVR